MQLIYSYRSVNFVRYSSVRFGTDWFGIQIGNVQYRLVRYTDWYGLVQIGSVWYSSVRFGTDWFCIQIGSVRFGTDCFRMVQIGTVWYSCKSIIFIESIIIEHIEVKCGKIKIIRVDMKQLISSLKQDKVYTVRC